MFIKCTCWKNSTISGATANAEFRQHGPQRKSALQFSNDQCQLMWDLVFALILEHSKRNLVLGYGLPRRRILLLGPESREQFLMELQHDLQYSEEFNDYVKADWGAAWRQRDVFQKTAVIQTVECCKDEGWKCTRRFQGLAI